jgi:hypothetical protein
MAPLNHLALQGVATTMIGTFGRSAILRTDDDPAQDVTVTVAFCDYDRRGRDGYLIQFCDRRALIAAQDGVPQPDVEKHTLVVDGQVFRIITYAPIKPASTAIYYDCQVRP